MEAPIHVSNVMPWSDKDGKGVRVRMGEEKGKKVRVSAASGAVLAAAPIQVKMQKITLKTSSLVRPSPNRKVHAFRP